jgi:nitrite reductase/ring-hydroxylating ferredoxin subunit
VASTLGYGLTIASSYVGGRLVFRHRVGVDHVDGRLTPRDFVPVLLDSKLPEDSPTLVDCSGVPVVLIRHEGRISALGGHCPHLGAPMVEGWLYRGQFVCPWHGSRFDLQTGAATSGPATSPLSCFQTRLREEQIEIRRIPPAQLATTGQTATTEGAQGHES